MLNIWERKGEKNSDNYRQAVNVWHSHKQPKSDGNNVVEFDRILACKVVIFCALNRYDRDIIVNCVQKTDKLGLKEIVDSLNLMCNNDLRNAIGPTKGKIILNSGPYFHDH